MEKKDSVLSIRHISVVFDGFKALTDVDINVSRHSIHFFIGPNGAGKTTLLDIICAKTKPTSGKWQSPLSDRYERIQNCK